MSHIPGSAHIPYKGEVPEGKLASQLLQDRSQTGKKKRKYKPFKESISEMKSPVFQGDCVGTGHGINFRVYTI